MKSLIGAGLISAALLLTTPAMARNLYIEITNLTPGTYFTPLLVAAHNRHTHLFEVGTEASDELQARVKALFRRVEALNQRTIRGASEERLIRNGMTIEVERRRARVDGHEIQLTAREFDLLLHFARHPGRVFNRIQLLDQVWGYNHDGYEHTLNSHINRLRAKVEQDPARPCFILTVWGIGYKSAED